MPAGAGTCPDGVAAVSDRNTRILYVVNEAYFFLSHRLSVARAARGTGFEVHVAAPADHVWAPEDFDVEGLRKEGFVFHPIPLSRRGMNPFRELITIAALFRLYRVVRPALVHHLTIKPVLYGGILCRLLRVPAVVNAVTGLGHVFVTKGALAAVLRTAVRLAYRSALGHHNGRVIVQNPHDGATLIGAGAVARERVEVIRGSGVPLDKFTPSPEPDGVALVIFPARLIWEKGVREFVEAASRLRTAGVAGRFALVNATKTGYPRAVPETQLRAWEKAGIVEWWGWCDDMPRVFAGCHVVCLPSSYGEGIPKVLLEAAASARPIVTTDIPGCREVVRDGENGFLVPPGDVTALTVALRRLIEDSGLRQRMGAAGRKIAEAEFSEEVVVKRTLGVYRELTV